MMKFLKFVVLLILLAYSGRGSTEFCKWEDENGVIHYAETCPEDVESIKVDTQPPPSQTQVEDAKKRSLQLTETGQAREKPKAEEQLVLRPRHTPSEIKKMEQERQKNQCDNWQLELAELERVRAWHEKQIDLKKLLHDNKCR